MKYLGLVSLLVGAAACAIPASAGAQDYISATVSAVIQAQMEEACRAGAPAPPKTIDWATSTSQASLDGYFALTAQSDAKANRKVFAMNKSDVSWKDADGALPVEQIGPKLGTSKPDLKLMAFVVGGDGLSARGLWQATSNATPDKPVYYAVDFSGTPKSMWGTGAFRIWHMAIFSGEAPQLPAAYCHYKAASPWQAAGAQ